MKHQTWQLFFYDDAVEQLSPTSSVCVVFVRFSFYQIQIKKGLGYDIEAL